MLKEKLKKAGLKLTVPRLLILDVLEKAKKPLSAKEVHQKIKNKVDLASVYRALKAFEKAGVAYIEPLLLVDLYYLAFSRHHHIRCRVCQILACVPCSHVITKVKGFTEIEHQMILTGLCENCRNKEARI